MPAVAPLTTHALSTAHALVHLSACTAEQGLHQAGLRGVDESRVEADEML
jgi:hypothetical protein